MKFAHVLLAPMGAFFLINPDAQFHGALMRSAGQVPGWVAIPDNGRVKQVIYRATSDGPEGFATVRLKGSAERAVRELGQRYRDRGFEVREIEAAGSNLSKVVGIVTAIEPGTARQATAVAVSSGRSDEIRITFTGGAGAAGAEPPSGN